MNSKRSIDQSAENGTMGSRGEIAKIDCCETRSERTTTKIALGSVCGVASNGIV